MSEVLVHFDEPQRASDGRYYVAQVRGHCSPDGLWEAWIEFAPCDGGEPFRTTCKTEQLTRGDLRYWAAGLSRKYLTEMLTEALVSPLPQHTRSFMVVPEVYEPRDHEHIMLKPSAASPVTPVVNPFTVYRHSGEYVLRQELSALHAYQLRDIISAFEIPDNEMADLARTFEDALAERIVAAVQQSVGNPRTFVAVGQQLTDA